MNPNHCPRCGRFLQKGTVVCCSFSYLTKKTSDQEDEAVDKAFVTLWDFIEEKGLGLPAENELKQALISLGKAAQVTKQFVNGSAASEEKGVKTGRV